MTSPRLIDGYMPRWDVRERHSVRVAAPPAVTYAAITTADFAGSPTVAALLALRTLPARLLGRGGRGVSAHAAASRTITLATLEAAGFRRLADARPTELVLGLEGQFWRLSGNVSTPSAAAFATSPTPAPGTARAIWNLTVTPGADGTSCVLATETRVLCADRATRRRFLPYWYLIRPGSGAIRRVMLRAIRRAAERGVA